MADSPLAPRLTALIVLRAVFITLLLGVSFLFKIEHFYAHPKAVSYYIISLYTLTIVYSLLVRRIKSLLVFAYFQIILDVLAVIALILITDGIESIFSFMLILTVLSSSIILNKRAGYVIASLSSILYGGLLDLQFYGLIPVPYESSIPEKFFLYNIFVHIVSLYITAFLGGYLSHRLEETVETLKEKDLHLKDLEFFNTKVIESLPSGLFTTDSRGKLLIFNRAAEVITGVSRKDVIGVEIDKVLPFLPFPLGEGRHEVAFDGAEGRKIIEIHISALRDTSGKDTGFIGVFQDLTQLKTLEAEVKEKEKWAAVGELSANIAHEIRNPLASMKGSIEMLREQQTPERYKEKLMGIAVREMERLNSVITDFLTYSRPRPLEVKKVDLNLLLDETLSLLSGIERNGGQVTIRKEFGGSVVVMADAEKLRQVFWNLGLNAFEAMPQGGQLTVSVAMEPLSVRIAFTDTGTGIPQSDLEKVFYPFYTTKNQGTGLGLAIVYRIIEEHGGRITARSVPGIRTVFEIILKR